MSEPAVSEPTVSEPRGAGRAPAGPDSPRPDSARPGRAATAAGYARSPVPAAEPVVVVDGWLVSGRRSTASLTLVDLTPWAKVMLKAAPGGAVEELVGARFGSAGPAAPDGPPVHLVVGSAPGEWLMFAAPHTAGEVLDWCRVRTSAVTGLVTAVDLTHGRALFRITGEHAADTLAALCPIDLSDDVTPHGTSFRSTLAELATEVVRQDRGREPSYLLHCERSSGQYLFDALLEAGAGYGIDVDGYPGTGNPAPAP